MQMSRVVDEADMDGLATQLVDAGVMDASDLDQVPLYMKLLRTLSRAKAGHEESMLSGHDLQVFLPFLEIFFFWGGGRARG